MKRTVFLLIVDGWGIGKRDESNPIHVVDPPLFKKLESEYPVTSLQASGISVGLPWGEVGNSEVGHLTLGAGKVIYQYYPRITLSIRDGTFFENKAIVGAYEHAKKNSSSVNLIGLLSKGNVHSSLDHIQALIEMGEKYGVPLKLHFFADGKDSPPGTLKDFLKEIPSSSLSSLIGRYYAMDREHKWQLTKKTYDTLLGAEGALCTADNVEGAITEHARTGYTEEFLPPLRLREDGGVKDGDAVFFFNFREDSMRQLAESFISAEFDKFPRTTFNNLYIASMTRYEERFSHVPVAFEPDMVSKPLAKILSDNGKTQLRVAETYKYAHVSYFFNGMQESPFKNEYRVLIPSISAVHVSDHPEMMAAAITDRLLQAAEGQSFDFVLANYANPDAIGHSGDYQAAFEAVRTIDRELTRFFKGIEGTQSIVIITSDHGNIEEILNPQTGRPETQHDPNPVPVYLVGPEFKGRKFTGQGDLGRPSGILADVAPTILEIMNLPKPSDMTGHSLLRNLT